MRRAGGSMSMKDLTLSDLEERTIRLEQQLAAAIAEMSKATAIAGHVTQLALARIGGHFTVDEAAIALDVSARTIKRKINAGEMTLEQIPGTRVFGIPASEIFGRWTPAIVARKAAERERKATR
jgi:excisionase family DNA binding protein